MASQPAVRPAELGATEFRSFIRGYHAYCHIWPNPSIGECLMLRPEPDNPVDQSAVAVIKHGQVVGHVPHNAAPVIAHFLRRGCNKGFVTVDGVKLNRGAGYGLEIPCTYRFYGPKPYTDRLQEVVLSMRQSGQL